VVTSTLTEKKSGGKKAKHLATCDHDNDHEIKPRSEDRWKNILALRAPK
jgi:hypothetical protein